MINNKKKLDYKWVILVLCILMNFVCLGFCSSNKGMYLTAITDALGIKRSLFSINDSCRYIASALVNLFFGTLIAKIGLRRIIAFGFVCTAGAMLAYAFAQTVLMFCVGGTLLGIGLAFTTTSMTGSIVRRWFKKDIGRYTGIVFASNGVGAALAAQIASPLINQVGNPFGYRQSYLLVVGILVVTGVVVVALMREQPKEDPGVASIAKRAAKKVTWYGVDFATAKKKHYFYLAGAAVLATGICLQGINSVYIAHLTDIGMRPEFTATLASIFSLALTGSKLLVGWMYDRFGLRVVMVICPIAAVIAFVLLATISATSAGMVMAVAFALLYALSLPLETMVIPLIVNDLFGSVSYDKLLGIFTALNYTGYALGAPIINLSFDIFGTYKHALLITGSLMLLCSIAFRFVFKGVEQTKKEVLQEQ